MVDKNTREALTRWISCQFNQCSSGESFDTCTKVTNYDLNTQTGIGQRCDSDSSVPETTGLKGCLLNDNGFRELNSQCVNEVRLTCCIKVRCVIIVPVTAVNPHIRTGKNRSMLPTASNCMGRPSNCSRVTALEAVTCQFQQSMPSNRKYTTFIRIRHIK